MNDSFEKRLEQAIAALPALEPREDLLSRILEDRILGLRVNVPAPTRRHRLFPLVGAGIAAAILFLLLVRRTHQPESATWLWPTALYAQGSPAAGLTPIPPRDGSLLRTGRWTYESRHRDDKGRAVPGKRFSEWIREGTYLDSPAWLFIRQRGSADPAGLLDTTWMGRSDLHPLARFSELMYGASLMTTYTGDSVVETWRKPDGTNVHNAAALPSPRLWDSAAVAVGWEVPTILFMTTPLNSDWQGSYAGTGVNNSGELVTFWWDLKTIGQERLNVPAGTFDCWKVAMMYDRDPSMIYWVDKTSGWIIKQAIADGRWELTLQSHAAE